jgi:hypothetical protein
MRAVAYELAARELALANDSAGDAGPGLGDQNRRGERAVLLSLTDP